MRTVSLAIGIVSITLTGCGMTMYGIKANIVGLSTKGNKDVSHQAKYWRSLQKNHTYTTKQPLHIKPITKEDRYNHILFPNPGSTDSKLSARTKITVDSVHYYSNGYTIWDTSYIGTIRSGKYSGQKVRLNPILKQESSDALCLDKKYLQP